MFDVQALQVLALRNAKQKWYREFMRIAKHDLQEATRWLNQSDVCSELREHCGWYPGKTGASISRLAAYVLSHPKETGACSVCGATTKLTYTGWAKTCSKSCAAQECQSKRVATNTARYGVCNPSKHHSVKEKRLRTFRQQFGCDNPFQNEGVKSKIRVTNLSRLGVENPSLSKEVLQKKVRNCQRIRGVDHWTQDPHMKAVLTVVNKKRHARSKVAMKERYGVTQPMHVPGAAARKVKTLMKKYGVPNAMFLPQTKEKMKATFMRRLGVDNPFKSESVKRKITATCEERYGVAHPVMMTRTKKVVTDHLGNTHHVVGYEDRAIKHLGSLQVKRIVSDPRRLPKVLYVHEKKSRTYYPDLGVVAKDGTKHLIEVKGRHTLEGDLTVNVAKFAAATKVCQSKGATFWVMMLTKSGWKVVKNPVALKDLKQLRR